MSDTIIGTKRLDETALIGARELVRALGDRFADFVPCAISERATYYLAREITPESGRPELVRLKVLGARTDADLELFYLESEAAAGLSHPNILKTSAAEEAGGVHFSVIAHHPEAETLSARLKRVGWLERRQVVEIITQVAQALEHAHESGVWHLRLQPEKILLAPSGTALVADFGVAANSRLGWASQDRAQDCAPPYLSPEQLAGSAPDHRSDLYALGVILYEMLTDRVPFDSRDLAHLRRKHLTAAPLAPHLLSTAVPETLSHVVLGLLEKKPEARFRSAAAFESAFYKSLNLELRSTVRIARPQVTAAQRPEAPAIPTALPQTPPSPPPPVVDSLATAALAEAPPSSAAPMPVEPTPEVEVVPIVGQSLPPSAQPPELVAAEPPSAPLKQEPIKAEPVEPGPVKPEPAREEPVGAAIEAEREQPVPLPVAPVTLEPPPVAPWPAAPVPVAAAPVAAPPVIAPPALKQIVVSWARWSAAARAALRRVRIPVWAILLLIATAVVLLFALMRTGSPQQETLPAGAEDLSPTPPAASPSPVPASTQLVEQSAVPFFETANSATPPPTPEATRAVSSQPAAKDPESKPTPESKAESPPPTIVTATPTRPPAAQLPSSKGATANPGGLVGGPVGEIPGGLISTRGTEAAPPPPVPKREEAPQREPSPTPRATSAQSGLVLGSVVRRVKPDYPVIARNAGVKGAVMVEVQVDEEGHVKKARALSGPMMLRGSAEAAARNWRFTPARLNGVAVKVTSNITFSFQD